MCVCVRVEGKHCSGVVTSNASAEHMAPQRTGAGGVLDSGGLKESNTSCTHWLTFAAAGNRCTRLGFLKGPGAQAATLQTCCSAWLPDQASAHRSCDNMVTINPCLTVPSAETENFTWWLTATIKGLSVEKKTPTFANYSLCAKLVLVKTVLITSSWLNTNWRLRSSWISTIYPQMASLTNIPETLRDYRQS